MKVTEQCFSVVYYTVKVNSNCVWNPTNSVTVQFNESYWAVFFCAENGGSTI